MVVPRADVEALIALGSRAERELRPADARGAYEQALRCLEPGRGAERAAALLRWVARTHMTEGDYAAADDCLAASLAVAEAHGSAVDVAHALNLSGIAHQDRGHLDRAVEIHARARRTALGCGAAQLVAMIDHNLGIVAAIQGNEVRAMDHYAASFEGFRGQDSPVNAAEVLNSLGMLYTRMGRWDEAGAAYEEALSIYRASGHETHRLMVEVNRAELWVAQGQFARARTSCDTAYALAARTGSRRSLAEIHKLYGVIFREIGHPRLAERHLADAEGLAAERQDLLLAAEVAREQAELFARQQRNQDTLQHLNRAHRLFTQLRARRDLADIARRQRSLEALFLEIVRRWGESIESADVYTQGHCERVADVACRLASLAGFDEQTLLWFRMGALLHDVGKIIVPPELLNKLGPLTPEERRIIERHPDAGVELLAEIEFPWDVLPMVRFHHERWDGTGYPLGLTGEEIPLAARILCIADVFDALTTDRPYRRALSVPMALDVMATSMTGHFDPQLLRLFVGEMAMSTAA